MPAGGTEPGEPPPGAPGDDTTPRRLALELVMRLEALIHQHPTFGYRRLWALVRYRDGLWITSKTLYRILKLQRWFVRQRPTTLYEFARRGRAKEAERALAEACLARFGTLRPTGVTPMIRSDNGLIYHSRRFRTARRDYRLRQEFIRPYTPEQNGMIERSFRSLKEAPVSELCGGAGASGSPSIPRGIF